jgi:hypothetical protein
MLHPLLGFPSQSRIFSFPGYQYRVSTAYPFMQLVTEAVDKTKDTPKDTV